MIRLSMCSRISSRSFLNCFRKKIQGKRYIFYDLNYPEKVRAFSTKDFAKYFNLPGLKLQCPEIMSSGYPEKILTE
jgi:hypothetical protein